MGAELLADQLTYNQRVLEANLKDVNHEDSLAAPAQGGNCLNWVVGHVVTTRNTMLKLLGREPVWDDDRAAPYRRASDPVTAETALPLAEIVEAFGVSQERLLEGLRGLGDEDLAAKAPMSFFKGDQETMGSALAAFLFHESYHVGQTGVLRRVAGKAGAIK
jgi:uncharacterized damage-inducible protein DinB